MQRSGNRVLISAQLIHAPSDRHLWAESYDRDLRDMLGLESEVAVAIATEIKAQISPQEQVRLASARPVNPEAHELDLRGLYYFEKDTPEGNKKAVQYFQKAIATDANDALAYALLAEIYDGLGEGAFRQMPREEAFRKAEAAARHAIQLDETVADAHSALAIAKVEWDWDWQGAEAEFKRAIELAPGEADPYHQHIMLLTPMGRHEEAIVEIRKGESLDPADVGIGADAGWVLNYAHLYDQAIAEELKILEMEPGFALAHLRLGESYTQKGLYKEALAEYKKWSDLSPGGRDPEALVAYTYARMGRTAEALKIVNQLKSEFRQGQPSVAASDLAQIYTALGDKDQALAWLETSIEKREEYPPYMRVDPALDPLHSDPRFQDLVRRMRFPE